MKTYQQLKRMSIQELWKYGKDNNTLDNYTLSLDMYYYNKSTLLELLSVTHREWQAV